MNRRIRKKREKQQLARAIRELVALAEKRQQKRQEAIDRFLTAYSAYLAKQGGAVAGNARKEIESKTGRPVVTAENASTMLLGQTVAGMIESVATEKDDEKSE